MKLRFKISKRIDINFDSDNYLILGNDALKLPKGVLIKATVGKYNNHLDDLLISTGNYNYPFRSIMAGGKTADGLYTNYYISNNVWGNQLGDYKFELLKGDELTNLHKLSLEYILTDDKYINTGDNNVGRFI